MKLNTPNTSEYPENFESYVSLAVDTDPLDYLQSNLLTQYLSNLNDSDWAYSYASGKWSVREMILHLIDAERVFCYRALRFSRSDKTVLSGFDQDLFVPNSEANQRSSESLLEEYTKVREATLALFVNFSDTQVSQIGQVGEASCSVNALAYIIAGHEMHHMKILKERYFIEDGKK